jgi:hypothetical protein
MGSVITNVMPSFLDATENFVLSDIYSHNPLTPARMGFTYSRRELLRHDRGVKPCVGLAISGIGLPEKGVTLTVGEVGAFGQFAKRLGLTAPAMYTCETADPVDGMVVHVSLSI